MRRAHRERPHEHSEPDTNSSVSQSRQCCVLQGFRDSLSDDSSPRKVNAYDPTLKFIESVASEILHTEQQVSCPWDPTLELDLPHLLGQKYLLAANFKNNEELLPHVIIQFWHVLAILPEGSAFVSVYESGSTDSTGAPFNLGCFSF